MVSVLLHFHMNKYLSFSFLSHYSEIFFQRGLLTHSKFQCCEKWMVNIIINKNVYISNSFQQR